MHSFAFARQLPVVQVTDPTVHIPIHTHTVLQR